MAERRDPENVEVEMLEDGPLLGDGETQRQDFQNQRPKHQHLSNWLTWGVLIIFCLIVLSDNIRLRQRQNCESAFITDLSKSKAITERMFVDAKFS